MAGKASPPASRRKEALQQPPANGLWGRGGAAFQGGDCPRGGFRPPGLDIDPRNGGDASLAQLQSKFPHAFKEPLEVRTGVGGRQFYFACSDPLSSRANILPGIDVKGDVDFVVVPPSLDVGGSRYQFASN